MNKTADGRKYGRNGPIDIIGNRYGRLVVLSLINERTKNQKVQWLCQCDCGNETVVIGAHLRNGETKSCGCFNSEVARSKSVIHGERRSGLGTTKEYEAWCSMKARCSRHSYTNFKYWGGRGIKVCDRWANSFQNFLADVGRKPSSKHSLDRYPDKDGDYEPGNVRWATRKQQNNNQRERVDRKKT
jgi:hypothetical protein